MFHALLLEKGADGLATAAIRELDDSALPASLPDMLHCVQADPIGAGGMKALIPGAINELRLTMRELERLIEAMQRHWLLRKYVNQTNPPRRNAPSEPPLPEKKPVKILRSPGDSAR